MDPFHHHVRNDTPHLPNRSSKRPMLYRFPSSSSLINEQIPSEAVQDNRISPVSPERSRPSSCPPTNLHDRAHRRLPSPTPSFKALIAEKWHTATEVLRGRHIEEALRRTKDLLSSCEQEGYTHPFVALLTANVGILHWHLGELDAALEYLRRARESPDGQAVIWFLFGCVAFEIGKLVEALHAFERSLVLLPLGETAMACAQWGMRFTLKRDMLEYNVVKVHEKIARGDGGRIVGIWRLPGGVVFEPLE